MERFLIAASITGALLVFAASASAQVDAEVALRAAIEKETVKGDLNGAIEQYKKIIAQYPDNHAIAARALLRMGGSYEKLGNPEYKNVYARLVAQYPGQPEAAQARARLNAKAEAEVTPQLPTEVLLWRDSAGPSLLGAGPSWDGSFVVYQDYRKGGLWRHDFAEGKDRQITADNGGYPKVSPDGRLVAYSWRGGGSNELRVIGVDGSGMRVLAKGDTATVLVLAAEAWSPDGARLLVHRRNELVLLSVADGGMTVVQSGNMGIGSTDNGFSPDGRYIAFGKLDDRITDPANADRVTDGANAKYVIWIMDAGGGGAVRLLSDPAGVQSMKPMWAPDGRSILFRSDRSGSVALWSVAVADGKAQGEPRFVLKDDMQPLLLMRDGSLFRSGSLTQNNLFAVSLDPKTLKVTSASRQLNRLFIDQVWAVRGLVAWSTDGRSVAYAANGNLILHSMDTDEDRIIKPAFPDPIRSRPILQYSSDGSALVVQRLVRSQTGGIASIHFSRIDVQTGNETSLFDVQNSSAAALAPDGKTVYYCPGSESPDGCVAASIMRRDVQSGKEAQLVQLSGRGLAGISVSADGRQISFQYVDPDGVRRIMVAPSGGGPIRQLTQGDYSVAIPTWTGDSRHLFLTSRGPQNGGPVQYWSVPAEGGAPQPVGLSEAIGFAASPQADRMAFSKRQTVFDLKLYKNLLPPAPAQ
jgi:Tol biopolymer transport system component